ncbi:hypothetical protein [Prosthecobacter sp.]|uniref:hypothetical protein n=1 Tax=Prosthecobacter sp. TaxID=1965333 RepID=UPI0037849820
MKRGNLRRFLVVFAVCLLSFLGLTSCVGIWSAAVVDSVHNEVTHRDERNNKPPTPQLKEWQAKQGPALKVRENQPIPPGMRVMDAELSVANGGRNASRPGTLVGNGASAIVDGLTNTLSWADPFTWIMNDPWRVKPSTPQRRLILRETPFVMLQGDDIRYTRGEKDGPVLLAKAKNAWITVITPDGSYRMSASAIHYRGPGADAVLLEPARIFITDVQLTGPKSRDEGAVLNFVKRTLSCSGTKEDYFPSGPRFKYPPPFTADGKLRQEKTR